MERSPDSNDSWDRGDDGGDYTVTGVSLSPGARDYFESPEDIKEGDTVYVTYVVYGDGDTFGRTGGYHKIIAVTKNVTLAEKAQEWAESIRYETRLGVGKTDWPSELGTEPYPSWLNYFSWLQSVRMEAFKVQA